MCDSYSNCVPFNIYVMKLYKTVPNSVKFSYLSKLHWLAPAGFCIICAATSMMNPGALYHGWLEFTDPKKE